MTGHGLSIHSLVHLMCLRFDTGIQLLLLCDFLSQFFNSILMSSSLFLIYPWLFHRGSLFLPKIHQFSLLRLHIRCSASYLIDFLLQLCNLNLLELNFVMLFLYFAGYQLTDCLEHILNSGLFRGYQILRIFVHEQADQWPDARSRHVGKFEIMRFTVGLSFWKHLLKDLLLRVCL